MKAIEHQLEIMQLRNSEESIHSSNMFDEIHLQDIFSKQRHAEGNNYCSIGSVDPAGSSDAQRQIQLGGWMIESGERQGVQFTRNWGYSTKAGLHPCRTV